MSMVNIQWFYLNILITIIDPGETFLIELYGF